MVRRFKTDAALVLWTRAVGESNREAFFLTSESGIVRATVYGGPKSKLRAFVSSFHSGALYLYCDPVRSTYKVTDFDVQTWRPGIRENYERTMSGGAVVETILAGHGGGGDWPQALGLANATLDALETADSRMAGHIVVYFFWNWAVLLGACPEPQTEAETPQRRLAALRWLHRIEAMDPSALAEEMIDDASLRYAKNLCIEILSAAFGRRLASWSAL